MRGGNGAILLIAGAVVSVVAVAIAMTGGTVGLAQRNIPPQTAGELVTLLAVVLFGLGAAAMSLSDTGPLRSRALRLSLGMMGVGFLSSAVASSLASFANVFIESYPIAFLLLGLALGIAGLLTTGVALARSTSWLRIAGAALLVGLIGPFLGTEVLQLLDQPTAIGIVLVLLVPFGLGVTGYVALRRPSG